MFSLFATEDQKLELAEKYRGGNFGYGHAKQELFLLLDKRLEEPREKYNDLVQRPDDVRDVLSMGAKQAREIAQKTLLDVRSAVGL